MRVRWQLTIAAMVSALSCANPARAASISWSFTMSNTRCEVGARKTYTCPAHGAAGTVWGSGIYTDDSSICTAAVHAGVIDFSTGGEVVIEVRPGMRTYPASAANGVSSQNWGAWSCSFAVLSPEGGSEVREREDAAPPETRRVSDSPRSSSEPFISVVRATPSAPAVDGSDAIDRLTRPPNEHHDVSGAALGMDLVLSPTMGDPSSGALRSMLGLRTMLHGRAGRRVAINLGMEQGFGLDPSGLRRYDLALTLPEFYFYVTPDSLLQWYTLSGIELRLSHYASGPERALTGEVPWATGYFGAFMGTGVEVRVSPRTSVRLELRGFLRGRIDDPNGNRAFNDAVASRSGMTVNVGASFF